jgi:hypothetical protein
MRATGGAAGADEKHLPALHTVRHWVQQRRQEPAPHTKPAYRARYTVASEAIATQVAAQRRLPAARRLFGCS